MQHNEIEQVDLNNFAEGTMGAILRGRLTKEWGTILKIRRFDLTNSKESGRPDVIDNTQPKSFQGKNAFLSQTPQGLFGTDGILNTIVEQRGLCILRVLVQHPEESRDECIEIPINELLTGQRVN